MLKYVILVIFAYLGVAIQVGFLSNISFFSGLINLAVLILIAAFFLRIEKEGLIFALIIAFFYDFYLYSYFGLAPIAILIIYGILVYLRQKIFEETNYLIISVSTFFAIILFDLIVYFGIFLNGRFDFSYIVLHNILPDALINLIIAVPFFIVVGKVVSILKLYRIIKANQKRFWAQS